MKLKKLIKDIVLEEVRGPKEVDITGVCANSKRVGPGNLFIAKRGKSVDGARFIPEAIAAGAVAILTDLYDPSLKNTTQLIHKNVDAVESVIAARFNEMPSNQLFMVAVTGTNGKTTTAYLVKHILDELKHSCGLIGTIEYIIGEQRYAATHTTPDVVTNQKLLREMVASGHKSAVMEVTSHALDQGRVGEIHFDVAIFTNLTEEHLDYHGSMEAYAFAKSTLFRSLDPRRNQVNGSCPKAIVNLDDPYYTHMLSACRVGVITYGIQRKDADLYASNIQLTAGGSTFELTYQGKNFSVYTPLVGRYNIYNCLAAIACGISQLYPIDKLIEAVRTFSPVSARLEKVPNPLGLQIYIDFAHTPRALENVLQCLNELNQGRIITVFGCGGDRDRFKRPAMAQISEKYSEISIVTSDNPRSENPEKIIKDIVQGFESSHSYHVEVDRRRAIEYAILLAKAEDIVLIAGKGHENYQTFAHHSIEFNDKNVVADICRYIIP